MHVDMKLCPSNELEAPLPLITIREVGITQYLHIKEFV